jgi:hypothetical protein
LLALAAGKYILSMQSSLDAAKPGTPAAALLGRVSGILGMAARPRVAPAEAEEPSGPEGNRGADPPRTALLKRAHQRLSAESLLHQQNLENITAMAFSFLSPKAAPERMDDAWLEYYYENARIISDRYMQMVWAKVLAGEANKPGSFSRRAVFALVAMDRADLEMLTCVRQVCIRFDKLVLFVYELKDPIYSDNGITFSTLLHLDEIGLANFTEPTEHSSITTDGLKGSVEYWDEKIYVEMAPQQRLFTGLVALTKIGEELAGVCEPRPIADFPAYIRRYWSLLGVKVGQPQEGAPRPFPAA